MAGFASRLSEEMKQVSGCDRAIFSRPCPRAPERSAPHGLRSA